MAAKPRTCVVWFRQDLRLRDHSALVQASSFDRCILLFVWDDRWSEHIGGAAQVFIREALRNLHRHVADRYGQCLVFRRGDAAEVVCKLMVQAQATTLLASRSYEPWLQEVDATVRQALPPDTDFQDFPGYLLYEPAAVTALNPQWATFYTPGHEHWGKLFPFWRACQSLGEPPKPVAVPEQLPPPVPGTESKDLDGLGLARPRTEPDWTQKIVEAWEVSEEAAHQRLETFLAEGGGVYRYERGRPRADLDSNSRLSPYFRWGLLSPRALYWAVEDAQLPKKVSNTFARRVFWRDHAYYQLHHFPAMRHDPVRPAYRDMWWATDPENLQRWRRGATGYPLVDAAMRQLWATGWMQQNLRMVVACFVVEALNVSWAEGARWFEDTLVDADLAINAMMWQSAGRCGADQWAFSKAPDVVKGIDPEGAYVRRWVPELAALPTEFLACPWAAPAAALGAAGVVLGETYPHRCVTGLDARLRRVEEAVLAARRRVAADPAANDGAGHDMVHVEGLGVTSLDTRPQYLLDRAGQPLCAA